ncbi:hypothetical protein GGI07_004693 [Coemansia sp. Benny D115]|nr:hypothetical protein GGI07_004693 [Coemansia sp. Benny D115]
MSRLRGDWDELRRLALMTPSQLHQLPFTALGGRLPLRSLRWRMHLDVLPAENFGQEEAECARVWEAAAAKERRSYQALRAQYMVDPGAMTGGAGSAQTMHPLSLDEDSPWAQYHADQELRATIMLDVARTFPETAFFRQPRVQRMLGDILFVYARMHPGLRYRQGMHELLAPLLLAVDSDAVDDEAFFLARVLDRRFVEHDAFALFDRLMRICAPWYQQNGVGAEPSALVLRCRRMVQRLAAVDGELAARLNALEIEPQLYGLRWLRLLFGREVGGLHSVLQLWDLLLADAGGPLQLVDWVGVVLLLANRRRLVHADYADCLATLLHLPPLPRPGPDTLEATPPLPNAPLPAGSLLVEPSARLPLAALLDAGMSPVQRLALQAAYLRSRPVSESAQIVAAQYALWEEEAWDVVGTEDAPAIGAEDEPAVVAEPPISPRARSPRPDPSTSPASMLAPPARKTYTSSTLQQQRRRGGGSAAASRSPVRNPVHSPLHSPLHSSPLQTAAAAVPVAVVVPESPLLPGAATALIAGLAAQCIDLLARLPGDDVESAMQRVAAALRLVAQAWQDDAAGLASASAGLQAARRELELLMGELSRH